MMKAQSRSRAEMSEGEWHSSARERTVPNRWLRMVLGERELVGRTGYLEFTGKAESTLSQRIICFFGLQNTSPA
jgi:hypothetical protein